MGDPQDKKPKPNPDAGADKKPGGDAANSGDAVGIGDQNVNGVDLRDLRDAYQSVHDEKNILFNKRAIGVREVPDALRESDPPSLADELMKTLIIAGLGYASGGITTMITSKILSTAASEALKTAVQTALDDGLKDAAGKVAAKLAEQNGSSLSQFFSSQEEGLESIRSAALAGIIKQRRTAEDKVLRSDKDKQASVLAEETKAANDYSKATTANADTGRSIQFRESLAKWMNAMSRGEMGTRKEDGGTDLFGKKGVSDAYSKEFYKGHGAKGVVYVNFGMTESRPGVGNSARWPSVKMSGVTQSALDRLKGTALRDLGMPVVVSGILYDGFLDSLDISSNNDNAVQFGRNEAGTTFVHGRGEGNAAMRKLTGKATDLEAATDLLDTNILPAKLDNVLSTA